jgi:hypothetical protein
MIPLDLVLEQIMRLVAHLFGGLGWAAASVGTLRVNLS